MDQSESIPGGEIVSSEDRLIAMFSHLSIFFGSLIVPLIFWAIYREKSKFVSFHSLQSLFFHLAYTVILVFLVIFVAIVGMLTGLFAKKGAPVTPDAFQIIVILALGAVVIGFIFGSISLAIYLAVSTYKGGMKKYPVIGKMVYSRVYGV
ncbi:MAG: DUF4870 domain-containing protein [Ignavibacteria bacterium]|nr:DUF4870 domain-containing protein [Ignavibacteria bacterium]